MEIATVAQDLEHVSFVLFYHFLRRARHRLEKT